MSAGQPENSHEKQMISCSFKGSAHCLWRVEEWRPLTNQSLDDVVETLSFSLKVSSGIFLRWDISLRYERRTFISQEGKRIHANLQLPHPTQLMACKVWTEAVWTKNHLTPPTEMIAIQNQSQGVTCASLQPVLCLQGNNIRRPGIKKFNDESGFYRCRWGTIDPLKSQNELSQADLHGSRQKSGHIQSHLTHSALTSDPWKHCPRVNCHLQGSIALDHRLRPLAAALGVVKRFHRKVDVGCGLVEAADLKGQVQWSMMMGEIYAETGSDQRKELMEGMCLYNFRIH